MRLHITFGEYLSILKGYSNVPLTLNRLTLPFGIVSGSDESDSLLVGHILEDLAERCQVDERLDCIDVVAAAYALGHDQAAPFLDEAPYIMYRMAQELGVSHIH